MQQAAQRIGILGGTFNPPHFAHLEMAQMAHNALRLDLVYFVVANDPPHKAVQFGVPAKDRFEMTALCLLNKPDFVLSDVELVRAGKSYTIDTVAHMQSLHPGAELFVIVGSDMLRQLHSWHRAPELLKMASFICVPREDVMMEDEAAANALRAQYGANIVLLHAPVSPISSTVVRAHVDAALPISGFLPQAAERYIYQHGLYLPEDIQTLHAASKRALSPKRFLHTIGVLEAALFLSARYHVDAKKARIAAILHDYGRTVDDGALTHAHESARLAKERFFIQDEEVLGAIRRHTTLGAGASDLDKIIYLADMIEPSRAFDGVERLRALARENLNAAVYAALSNTMDYLKKAGVPIQEDTMLAAQELADVYGFSNI